MAKRDSSIDEVGNDLFPYMNRPYYKAAMPLLAVACAVVVILVDRSLSFGWAILALLVCLVVGSIAVHRVGMKIVERSREEGDGPKAR